MTPGQEALREAARLESARVYGGLCREHKPEPAVKPLSRDAELTQAIRAGMSTSDLIAAFSVDYATVRAVRKRVMKEAS